MGKQSGLGFRWLAAGYDVSGDISALDTISGGPALGDFTDITQSAHARLGLLRDGQMAATAFMDAANAHPVLSALPRTDVQMMALVPPLAVGAPVACLNAKQIDYNGTRSAAGDLTLKTSGDGSGFGLEWGLALTPGVRTDTTATSGTALDNAAATAWGAQAYLQVTGFTGTSVTVTVQQSADNSTWVTLLAFTAVTAAPAFQRAATAAAQSFTATNASPCVFTVPGSAPASGTPVALSGASLPAGFTAGTVYYVVSSSGSTFQLSATSGGSAINSTSTGTGTVTPAVLRYLRVITAGTFSSASLAVMAARNPVAVRF